MNYLFATHNPGKLKEIRVIFAEKGLTVRSPEEMGIAFDPTETGHTFTHNAMEKARNCAALCQQNLPGDIISSLVVLADDSGLCIDALDG